MNVPVLNTAGSQVSTIDLPADIFEYPINVGLMHQYVVMQNSNARLGTHKTKRRSEVNRTKAKWYRQKGTGRARHGQRSAPIFVGGGRAHGPVPHKHTLDMPKSMRHAAIKSALSAILADGQLVFVEQVKVNEAKTKLAKEVMTALVGDKSALILLPERDVVTENAFGNLPNVKYVRASYVNVRDLLTYERVILPLASLEIIKTILSKKEKVG
jgi:large subunit ribosomal protein L4